MATSASRTWLGAGKTQGFQPTMRNAPSQAPISAAQMSSLTPAFLVRSRKDMVKLSCSVLRWLEPGVGASGRARALQRAGVDEGVKVERSAAAVEPQVVLPGGEGPEGIQARVVGEPDTGDGCRKNTGGKALAREREEGVSQLGDVGRRLGGELASPDPLGLQDGLHDFGVL